MAQDLGGVLYYVKFLFPRFSEKANHWTRIPACDRMYDEVGSFFAWFPIDCQHASYHSICRELVIPPKSVMGCCHLSFKFPLVRM